MRTSLIQAIQAIVVASMIAGGCASDPGAEQDLGPAGDSTATDLAAATDRAAQDLPGADPDLAAPDTGADLPLDGFGTISGACGELDDTEWGSSSPYLFRNAIDFGTASFDSSKLSTGGQQILSEGNRSASSLHSEIFAYEVLYRCELAKLLKTEKKISYTDPNGKKTDLLAEIDARRIGVSVTRAFHYPPSDPYTAAEAKTLLDDKLADLPLSLSNATAQDAWTRSILHVMAYDSQYADAVEAAWKTVDPAVKGDAILILTVTDGADDFIY
jgi:hypothetical protein